MSRTGTVDSTQAKPQHPFPLKKRGKLMMSVCVCVCVFMHIISVVHVPVYVCLQKRIAPTVNMTSKSCTGE